MPGPKTEKQWQAEADARTLADAKMIEADARRRAAAVRAANQMVVEQQKQASALQRVARSKPRKR